MTTYHLRRRQTVPGQLPTVFAFFKEPKNLQVLTPDWLHFRILEESDMVMREGALISYRLRWQGFPVRWTSRIAEYRDDEMFADEMLVGPYKRWYHRHIFRAVPGGVEMLDDVEYEMPFGPAGRLAHAVLVRRQLEAIFDFRARSVAAVFRGATTAHEPRPQEA